MSTWIDFKHLREELDFAAVLRHYGVELKLKGDQHQGFCPLPNHNGKRNSPSFSANVTKGIFQCFGCGARGNLLHFAALMENLNPDDGRDFRKAALILKKQFCPDADVTRTRNPKEGFVRKSEKKAVQTEIKETKELIVNAPLDFELKDLDAKHPYLADRKLTPETIKHFGLGFCSRGYFKNRVVIPLQSGEARLIGYAGRVVDDTEIAEDSPKYLFPGSRDRDGKSFEFRKSEFLYNGHALTKPVDNLAVVEGMFSVHWLFQNGIANSVALMGWACSEQQAKLIVSHVKPKGRVWIFSDGDEAGERCATSAFQLVAPHRSVRWAKLEKGKQPTDCSKEELASLLPY
jgi:DNA primase